METPAFHALVAEAIASVPADLRSAIENVVFVVEDDSRRPLGNERVIRYQRVLLGLYEGVPLTRRGVHYSLVPPDKITIFHKPIEELGGSTEQGIRQLVFDVVHHEIGHYFGFSDAALRKMEQVRKRKTNHSR